MTETATQAPANGKAAKTFTRTVTAGREQLQFIGTIRKNGTVNTYVTHRVNKADGKLEKSSRGGTQEHANIEAAKAEVEKGVQLAIKQGWQERKGGGVGNYKPRADSFTMTSLPKAPAAK